MSVRNALVLLLALSTLSLLVGCGSSNNSPTVVPPPTGSFSNSNLMGTYVFSISGLDNAGAPFAIVGTIAADGTGGNGKGGISGGTIDIVDAEFTPVFGVSINGNGFYSVGQDGRGQATIGTSTTNPFNSNLTFDFVLTSSSHGLITEFDGNASGSGTIDLQTSGLTQASLAGPYAFSFSGVDGNTFDTLATAGAFTLGADGTIAAGADEDFNDADLPYIDQSLSGSVALGPSSTPATTLSSTLGGLTFDVYAIDSTHLKFIETDALEFLSGDAYSQTSATVPTGNLAFTTAGFLGAPIASAVPFAAGGYMNTDGGGGIAGSEDENDDGSPSPAAVTFSANYSSAGTGRFVLNNFANFIGGTQYAAYPSSGGLLLLEIDGFGVTTGVAYAPQSTTTFASGQGYGLNLTGLNLTDGVEVDDISEFSVPTGTTCPTGFTLCGIIDENFAPGGIPTPPAGLALDGTLAGPDASGRYSLVATAGNSSNTTLNGGFGLTFYSVDGTTFPFIESDPGQVATGVIVLQNSAAASAATAHSHMFVPRPLFRAHSVQRKRK